MDVSINKDATRIRILMFMICILFSWNTIKAQTNGSIRYNFSITNYSIIDTLPHNANQQYKYIQINDSRYFYTDSVGLPLIPVLNLSFAVPTDAHNFALQISNTIKSYYNIDGLIVPCQPDHAVDDSVPDFIIDSSFYISDTIGTTQCSIVDSFVVSGYKGITICIFPFQYSPSSGNMTVLQSADIQISYISNTKNLPDDPTSVCVSDYLSNVFNNFDPPKNQRESSRYLIVTHPNFMQDIEYFADYKRNIGYTTEVVATCQNPTSCDIKQIIKDRYDNIDTRPDFVLLVGDNSLLPACEGEPSADSIDYPLTDFFYSTMDGNNDWYADVFLGRFPVSGIQELKNIINKTIYMEMNNHLFEKNVVLVSGDDDNYFMRKYFEKGHKKAIDNAFIPAMYNIIFLKQPSDNDVSTAINTNPSLFIYSGHGSINSLRGNTFILRDSNIVNLTNSKYPIYFAFACKTGAWGAMNNFGKAMLISHSGGIAYIGSSVSTYSHSDYAIEKCIFDSPIEEKVYLGSLFRNGMSMYHDRVWSDANQKRTKRYMKAYNLLGDPSFLIDGRGCLSDLILKNGHHLYIGDSVSYSADGMLICDDNFVADNGSKISFTATESIVIKPDFHIKNGAIFSAKIVDCERGLLNTQKSKSSKINIDDNIDTAFTQKRLGADIYPNPASSTINITVNTCDEHGFDIHIFDIRGVLLISKSIQNNSLSSSVTIPINELPSGCYIVQICQKPNLITKTFIKQ